MATKSGDGRDMTAAPSTAAIILIGNELLSGKIRDENAFWLTGR